MTGTKPSSKWNGKYSPLNRTLGKVFFNWINPFTRLDKTWYFWRPTLEGEKNIPRMVFCVRFIIDHYRMGKLIVPILEKRWQFVNPTANITVNTGWVFKCRRSTNSHKLNVLMENKQWNFSCLILKCICCIVNSQ